MLITDIRKVGRTNRFRIFADGIFFATVMDETLVLNNIKIGSEFDLDTLNSIVFEGQKKLALDTSFSLLSKFSKTQKELIIYLKEKGFMPNSINYAIGKLKEYNYLNDELFAKNYINNKKEKKGKKAIFYELKNKGVNEKVINKYLESIEKQDEIIIRLAQKFYKNKENDSKIKEKLFRHLVSKGFEFEEIKEAINKVIYENRD